MNHINLRKAKKFADSSPDNEKHSLRSIAHALITIAEQIEKHNKFMAQVYTGTSKSELVDIAYELGLFSTVPKEDK